MTAGRSLLRAARAEGLSLDLAGDDLIVEADRDPPAALLAELRLHKAEVVAALKEDRAELEYPRAWAKGLAQLDPDRPPGDMPDRRWRMFIDDVAQFLDSGFAAQAVVLGWGPHDLFGCDGDRPVARVDKAGLLWLLHGHKLIALTADTATIATVTGSRLTYRRTPGLAGRVLPWELA